MLPFKFSHVSRLTRQSCTVKLHASLCTHPRALTQLRVLTSQTRDYIDDTDKNSTASGKEPVHKTTGQTQRLLLIDTSCEASRLHFGYGDNRLHNNRGEDTTIMFGLLKDVIWLMQASQSTHLAFVRDGPKNCVYRRELYPQYKAGRSPVPEVLTVSLERLTDLLGALGVPCIMAPGVEADDFLAYLTAAALADGMHVDICSSDKDFFQLLGPNVRLWRSHLTAKGHRARGSHVMYTAEDFAQRYGILPEQWADCLALMGDSSDNIPGVKGIGDKTATKLLRHFGTLDSILASPELSSVASPRAVKALDSDASRSIAKLSRQLVQLQPALALESLQHSAGVQQPCIFQQQGLHTYRESTGGKFGESGGEKGKMRESGGGIGNGNETKGQQKTDKRSVAAAVDTLVNSAVYEHVAGMHELGSARVDWEYMRVGKTLNDGGAKALELLRVFQFNSLEAECKRLFALEQ